MLRKYPPPKQRFWARAAFGLIEITCQQLAYTMADEVLKHQAIWAQWPAEFGEQGCCVNPPVATMDDCRTEQTEEGDHEEDPNEDDTFALRAGCHLRFKRKRTRRWMTDHRCEQPPRMEVGGLADNYQLGTTIGEVGLPQASYHRRITSRYIS